MVIDGGLIMLVWILMFSRFSFLIVMLLLLLVMEIVVLIRLSMLICDFSVLLIVLLGEIILVNRLLLLDWLLSMMLSLLMFSWVVIRLDRVCSCMFIVELWLIMVVVVLISCVSEILLIDNR